MRSFHRLRKFESRKLFQTQEIIRNKGLKCAEKEKGGRARVEGSNQITGRNRNQNVRSS